MGRLSLFHRNLWAAAIGTALIPLLLTTPCRAQINLASVEGIVSDPSGRALPGARLTLTADATGLTRTTVANAAGQYSFPALDPGSYTLRVQAKPLVAAPQRFTLEVNQRLRLDLALKLGTVVREVEVVAGPQMLRTDNASLGEVVEPAMVRNLPLNGGHLLDLALLAPGVHAGSGAATGNANPLYWRPLQDSALVTGGARPNANNYLLDGATDVDPTFNTLTLSPATDAIQEFKVETGSYSAEFGGGGGAQIVFSTRSGGNQWHGDAYEYLRNSALDARAFNEPGKIPHLAQNQYGASVGGPIQKDRTFVFANYEGFRLSQGVVNFETVPTMAERMGDFQGSGLTIYDPATTHANPNFNPAQPASPSNPKVLRDPFPNDSLPSVNPVVAQVLATVPLPNFAGGASMGMGMGMGGGSGQDSNNYLDRRTQTGREDQGTVRIDRNLGSGNTLFGRYTIEHEKDFVPQNLPGFGAYDDNLAQNATISYTRILSPETVNRLWAAMSRLSMHRYSENNFTHDYISQLGIQGVGFGGYGAWGMPWFAVQGYSGFGDSFNATPVQDWDTVVQFGDLWNHQAGRHQISVGGDFRLFTWPMWGFFQNRGFYQFTNGFTTQTATNDSTGAALADFELGLPVVKQRQAGIPVMDLRQWYADGFYQDDWRVTPSTTLNLGLRYEFMSPLTDGHWQGSNVVFENGQPYLFIGGQAGMPAGLLFPNKLNFAPRLGFTQAIGWGLIVRGSFGIFYTPVDMNTWCNQRHNPPLVFQESQQSDNFTPSLQGFNFGPAVFGTTGVSVTAFDPHSPAQRIHQWSLSVEKSLARDTVVELGYTGARGYHLQQMVLVNNAAPGPGPIGPRRPYHTISYLPGTDLFPIGYAPAASSTPLGGINQLENSAATWYEAGWIDARRRFTHGLTFLANFTWSKNLSTAPDFRAPMAESAIPQNSRDLAAEKGPACDIPLRFVASLVYRMPSWRAAGWTDLATRNWDISSVFQAQSGYPLTIQVFGDTANAGTLLGQDPIRANVTGAPLYPAGTHTTAEWFNPAAFVAPPAYQFGDAGRNSIYGPGMQNLDLALTRQFDLGESRQFQFRAEFFNALNHSNFGMPNNFVNEPQFASITMAATPGREIQFGGRYVF